jgi:hypothetical protein
MEDHFRFARYPGVIHVAEGTFPVRGTKVVLAAYVFHEGLVGLLPSTFDK